MSDAVKTVKIPACDEHCGRALLNVTVYWICPVCGQARGEVFDTHSFDGSRRLPVHGWINQCGHVDKYSAVRAEAAANGLN